MKKLLTGFIFLFSFACTFAQVVVTGTVTSAEDQLPLPGVTVIIRGTDKGTITNPDGFYTIEASADDTLVFSYVGMQTTEMAVAGQKVINVVLVPGVELKEIVVTALGIKRESKALGYSATNVGAEEITESRDRSVLNSLQGKIAGVDISSSSGAPGSSTRIILRGISSLGGSNQPLFIIDGVPVNNSSSGSSSINGGTDFGNGINDINPDDIESVNFLKGAAGAALYGSRAANGVIILTTKKGKTSSEGKPQITFTSSLSYEEPLRLVEYQNDFGQGINGDAVSYENMSWGPQFDSKLRYWGNEVDNTLRVKAYKGLPDNVKEFFDTGVSYNNAFSISGGGESATYFLSYSNISHDGIFPTNADSYNRNTIGLRGSVKASPRLTASTSLNYVRNNNKFVPTGQGNGSVYNQVMQTPRDISLIELSDINSKWNNVDNYYSIYTVNPYFILKENGNENNEDRIFGNLEFNYKINSMFSAVYRFGGDLSNERTKTWKAKIEPKGNNAFASVFETGEVGELTSNAMQINSDLMLTFQKELKNFTINGIIGHNLNQRTSKGLAASVNNLTVPGFYELSNSSETPSVSSASAEKRLVGVYGSLDLSFKSVLFLGVTARNDWSSTLSPEHNSYFYPGVNASFVFTDLLPKMHILPFGKIRVSLTRVGNDASPYLTSQVFVKGGHSDGYGFLRYPLPNNVNSLEVSNLIGNENLKPEQIQEFEAGTDLRFVKNRIGIDFTWYDKTTTDLIWPVPLPGSSGYSLKTINLGKLTNKGIEALLSLTPVQKKNLKWDISFNFSRNRNTLVALNEGLERVVLNGISVEGGQQIYYVGKPGRPVGIFEARTVLRDDKGRIIVDNTGLPKAADELIEYGDREYDFIGGINSRITYKGFLLSATMDIKQGGIMYSRTKDISYWAGTVPETVYNMREPFIVPNSVYEVGLDENRNPVYADNTIPLDATRLVEYWGNGGTLIDGNSFIDKSYVKLREVVVSYSIPKKYTGKIGLDMAELSVIGRNLLLFTTADQKFIDPELTTFGTDINADFGEYGAQPSVRSITVSLRIVL